MNGTPSQADGLETQCPGETDPWAAGPIERRQRRLGHSLRHPSSSLREPQVLTTKALFEILHKTRKYLFFCPKERMQGREKMFLLGRFLEALHPGLLPVLVIDGAVFTHSFPPALNRRLTAPVPSSSSLSKATFPCLIFSSLLFSAQHHLLLTVQHSLLGTCHFQKTEHLGTQSHYKVKCKVNFWCSLLLTFQLWDVIGEVDSTEVKAMDSGIRMPRSRTHLLITES